MLAGKSLPPAPADVRISVHHPGCFFVPCQICGDSPAPRHDRRHIRLDTRLQSGWQGGNERPRFPLTPRLSHPVPALRWIAEWLTVIIWPCLLGRLSLWSGITMRTWLSRWSQVISSNCRLICQKVVYTTVFNLLVYRNFLEDSVSLRWDCQILLKVNLTAYYALPFW